METRYALVCVVLASLAFTVVGTGAKFDGYGTGFWDGNKCICGPSKSEYKGYEPPRPFYELFPGIGYYKLHTNSKTWHEAKLVCEKEGTHLAIINSKEELEIAKELRRRLPTVIGDWQDDHCFIGMNDIQHEGVWRTIDDISLAEAGFAEWANNEPNGGTNENCGVLIVSQGKFNDAPCSVKRGFFCERKL